MAAKLLIYHMEEGKRQIVEGLCRSLGIEPVYVSEASHRAPVGLVSGTADPRSLAEGASLLQGRTAPEPVDEEMIVMSQLSEMQFNALLDGMRTGSVRVSLKAVETPSNRLWTGEMLQTELKEEREAFRKGRQQ